MHYRFIDPDPMGHVFSRIHRESRDARRLYCRPIPVEFGLAFPAGAYAAGVFEPVRDFEGSSNGRFVQSKDKATGLPLWVVEVIGRRPAFGACPDGQGQGLPRSGAAGAAEG